MSLTAKTIEKPANTNISRQILRGALLGLVLVPTILVWAAIASSFFGYRAVSAHGISMEPALRNGDALWVKPLDITSLLVGDIVTVMPPGEEAVTHRIVNIEPISTDIYLLATKGDANHFTEGWEINPNWIVALVVARIPFGGYVLDFLSSVFGRVLMSIILIVSTVTWVRRRRRARYTRSTGNA